MRICYQCKKEIADVEWKYFCSKECWDKFGSHMKPIKGTKKSIEEIQAKLLEFSKEKHKPTDEENAKKIGLIE